MIQLVGSSRVCDTSHIPKEKRVFLHSFVILQSMDDASPLDVLYFTQIYLNSPRSFGLMSREVSLKMN